MHNLKELKIWQKAIDITKSIYNVTKKFPSEEKFGLVSQMRRAAVSISSNIAEGAGRNSPKEFLQFISIANGSCYELFTQSYISYELEIIKKNDFDVVSDEIKQLQNMLFAFSEHLKSNYLKS
ncbi:four helix bundle protein [Marivirga arenosa]|uniref:Four helix bundle protein n=1 Tax=Marivirga arenosa TaxID=3059076 RepID=A0AA49JDL3_9BACT|nr:four helix bundle protein [Marivirga sp. ABR2-2]WKK85840.2 four helix bundle protein [Marivirga sp. ABR2-2]